MPSAAGHSEETQMRRFLYPERSTLDEVLPGLDQELASASLSTLERRGNPGLQGFRRAGGCRLLVPAEHDGIGASALMAVRIQRAIGARSPSLAIATTMHHFSIACLVEASRNSTGFEWMMLSAIAKQDLLVASGFAEGRTGQAILAPTMRAERRDGRVYLTGTKKPCSLSASMDLLTASVTVPGTADEPEHMAVALIPRDAPGLSVHPFWGVDVLAGAESDEVRLDQVELLPDLVVATRSTAERPLDVLQSTGFVWFELLMAASYLGVASALVERVLSAGRATAELTAQLIVEAEAAMAIVENIARRLDAAEPADDGLLSAALIARFAVQGAIARIGAQAVESLGGMAFIGSGDVSYLSAASAALAFHPPSRARMAQPLCDYFAGQPLRMA
jgi:alkylation response protein AidB-like acyl-CoA dehydrogenase